MWGEGERSLERLPEKGDPQSELELSETHWSLLGEGEGKQESAQPFLRSAEHFMNTFSIDAILVS